MTDQTEKLTKKRRQSICSREVITAVKLELMKNFIEKRINPKPIKNGNMFNKKNVFLDK